MTDKEKNQDTKKKDAGKIFLEEVSESPLTATILALVTGLLLGVGLDVLEGAVLGQNAFALVVVALLSLTLYQRLRVYSLWQQASVVFVLIGINQLICQWVQNLEGAGAGSLLFLLPAFSSALLWPVVLHTLRGLRRYYRVH